jgi:hypothetical protein
MRNTNRNSKEYSLSVCDRGLNITRVMPESAIISGQSPVAMNLQAETSGCINGGEATCYYDFVGGIGGQIPFLTTGGKYHSQEFTSMPAGNHTINITCTDEAGNSDSKVISASVFIDNVAPTISRVYNLNDKLSVYTTEDSECRFVMNESVGCSFNFYDENASVMEAGSDGKTHTIPWAANKDYYIKCSDIYNNTNLAGCAISLRTTKKEFG